MAALITGANVQNITTSQALPRGTAFESIAGASSNVAPTVDHWESIWGPIARDLKLDPDRFQEITRRHLTNLPRQLQGPQLYIADRVDGLITGATGSPFTSLILPYVHWDSPDGTLKWRVWSFEEGMASRVPYEAAARTLTESQQKFKAHAARQGLAITMEHNFMMSEQGRKNFYYRLQQMVGSIQKTNDMQVHVALIKAPSYFREVRERYYRDPHSIEDEVRDYVNTFGFLQKNVNGLDILIEDAKQLLRGWGGSEPNFLLINSRLTFQLQMNPERTSYITCGADGKRRLEQGPDIKSYRGIRIIHSHSFPINEGEAPRDLLRHRTRTPEFYLIPNCCNGRAAQEALGADAQLQHGHAYGAPITTLPHTSAAAVADAPPGGAAEAAAGAEPAGTEYRADKYEAKGSVRMYDESSDSFVVLRYDKLLEQCRRFIALANARAAQRHPDDPLAGVLIPEEIGSVLLIRPNIEHYMHSMIMGTGGNIEDLGATVWGQTELSCFDDGQHGVWGMSYKYHATSVVFNHRNLHRIWDIAYDGYVGGKDCTMLDWGSDPDVARFTKADSNLGMPYNGPSIICIPLPTQVSTLPSPLPIANMVNSLLAGSVHSLATADLFVQDMAAYMNRVEDKIGQEHMPGLKNAVSVMYDLLNMHRNNAAAKNAAMATLENEATIMRLAYGGTYHYRLDREPAGWNEIYGCGHHGPDAVGKASERAGKGFKITAPPQPIRVV